MQEDQNQPEDNVNWSFKPDEKSEQAEKAPEQAPAELPDMGEVSWTASEYIAHEKSLGWYAVLTLVSAAIAALAFLVTRDFVVLATIIIVAVTFGAYASRKPQTLDYKIDHIGVTVGVRLYPFSMLKSFSLQEEGAIKALDFMPMKRFMPAISVYFPPEQEEEIVATLSNYLPHEERPPDAVDRLMRKVRF